tara:strand:- start:75 stop:248 length:174 start_codon:yes stop_codon:yes gene_type:complete
MNVNIVIIIVNPNTMFEDHPNIIDCEKNFINSIQIIKNIFINIPIKENIKNLVKISS